MALKRPGPSGSRPQAIPQGHRPVEVYRDAAASAAHKETAHYATWREAAASLVAEPRRSEKYLNVSPDDAGW
jgi:quinol monooxygenase YgiN